MANEGKPILAMVNSNINFKELKEAKFELKGVSKGSEVFIFFDKKRRRKK